MNSDTVWLSLYGEATTAFCLGCPDSPCTRFTHEELAPTLKLPMSQNPDVSVCPSSAISQEAGNAPQLDSERCTSCGICIARCPVGALHLGNSGVEVSECDFDPVPYEETEFLGRRALLSESLRFADQHDEVSLIQRLTEVEKCLATTPESDSVLRMLVRNLLIVVGLPTQLSRTGDNNAVAECVVEVGDSTMLLQVEPGSDLLDNLRRAMTTVAVADSRYGLPKSELIAGVVVVRLPHKRVDYYEVITDVEKRLGLKIRTLPLAILLAAVGNPTLDFVELVINGMIVSSQVNTLSEDLGKLIGPTQDPEQLGVVPAK